MFVRGLSDRDSMPFFVKVKTYYFLRFVWQVEKKYVILHKLNLNLKSMKKAFLLAIVVFMATVSASAHKVVLDTYDDDGTRFVSTDRKRMGTISDFVVWPFVSMFDSQALGQHFMISLEFTTSTEMIANEEATLLIKTMSGNVFTLKSHQRWSHKRSKMDIEGITPGLHIERLTLNYLISEDDLKTIIEEGVAKIRIQLTCNGKGLHDAEFTKDKLGKILGEKYNFLKSYLETHATKQDITDGF